MAMLPRNQGSEPMPARSPLLLEIQTPHCWRSPVAMRHRNRWPPARAPPRPGRRRAAGSSLPGQPRAQPTPDTAAWLHRNTFLSDVEAWGAIESATLRSLDLEPLSEPLSKPSQASHRGQIRPPEPTWNVWVATPRIRSAVPNGSRSGRHPGWGRHGASSFAELRAPRVH